jgi:aspartate aminotransferase-like enzyme
VSAAFFKPRLLAPGPVEVPPAVLEALARPVTHHRAPAFREAFLRARERLATVFSVPGDDVLIVTGSGTAGFEAALVSAVPAGDRVLALHAGRFGERWAAMAESLGYQVEHLEAAPGAEFDLSEVAERLDATSQLAAVTLVQSETSTGALHDVRAVAELVRRVRPEALVLVDAVTSLACAELRPLEWGLDAVVSGSQKGVMTPPGLAFVWLSERAWQRSGEAGRAGSYYLDLHRERAKQAGGQTAFTPAVSLVAGLDVALGMLLDEGLENVWRRRAGLNAALLAKLGMTGVGELRPWALALGLFVTLIWVGFLARVGRSPLRPILVWTASLTFIWVLLMALFQAPLDRRLSYVSVGEALAARVPPAACIQTHQVRSTQRLLLAYHSGRQLLVPADAGCDWLLLETRRNEPEPYIPDGWLKRWEGARPGDRSDRFHLYARRWQ